MGHIGARRWVAGLVAATSVALVGTGCTPASSLTPAQQVDQIIGFVEAVRGHSFVTPPVVTFESDAQFRQDVLDNVAAAKPAVDAAEPTFKALGWLAPTDNLYAKYQIAFGGAVAGFYDPASKVLKVRGTDLTPYRREVIAHELTHALDDQLFGLDDDFGDGLLGQSTFSALVAIEGDATRTQQAYYNSMSGIDQAADIAEQLSMPIDPQLLTVPLALLTFTQVPYTRGGQFVYDIAVGGGTPAIDALFSRYPATAEQGFDTAKYLANEPATPVPTPPAAGTVSASGTWGQYLLSSVLASGAALDVAPVTQGWAGDAYVSWTSGAQACFRLDTAMDTQAEADALQSSLEGWASSRSGATITATGPATVRLTSCD